jgi:hypothetical protein
VCLPSSAACRDLGADSPLPFVFFLAAQLLRLRQLTCHPKLIPEDNLDNIGGWAGDEVQNERDMMIALNVHGRPSVFSGHSASHLAGQSCSRSVSLFFCRWVQATSDDLDHREWGPDGQACVVCESLLAPVLPTDAGTDQRCFTRPRTGSSAESHLLLPGGRLLWVHLRHVRQIVSLSATLSLSDLLRVVPRRSRYTPYEAKYPVQVPPEEPELDADGKPKKKKKGRKKKVDPPVDEPPSPTRTTSTTIHPGYSCPTCHAHLDHRACFSLTSSGGQSSN